jgi:hypothetical protein
MAHAFFEDGGLEDDYKPQLPLTPGADGAISAALDALENGKSCSNEHLLCVLAATYNELCKVYKWTIH